MTAESSPESQAATQAAIHMECWSANNEDFTYEALNDLLDAHDDLKPGNVVYVGEADHPSLSELCDVEDVLSVMADRAYDIGGEYAEDFPDVSKEATDELRQLLEAWMTKHCAVGFYRVTKVRPYVLKEEDFPTADSESLQVPFVLSGSADSNSCTSQTKTTLAQEETCLVDSSDAPSQYQTINHGC